MGELSVGSFHLCTRLMFEKPLFSKSFVEARLLSLFSFFLLSSLASVLPFFQLLLLFLACFLSSFLLLSLFLSFPLFLPSFRFPVCFLCFFLVTFEDLLKQRKKRV